MVGEAEDPPPALDGVGVVAVVQRVVGEGRAVAEVEGPGVDRNPHADLVERGHEIGIEDGARHAVA